MVIWDTSTFPGVVLTCRALGVVKVDQRRKAGPGRERNDRVIALPLESPRFDHLESVRDLPARRRRELEQFFLAVTALERKDAKILGWEGPAAALRLIRCASRAPRDAASGT
jgi:inorganic pyrophosphatase